MYFLSLILYSYFGLSNLDLITVNVFKRRCLRGSFMGYSMDDVGVSFLSGGPNDFSPVILATNKVQKLPGR